MDSNYEKEIREEIKYLEDKKWRYGWTKKDTERYHFLLKKLGKD